MAPQAPSEVSPPAAPAGPARRPVRLRPPVIGARAAVGGLVVAGAMVAAFALATRAEVAPGRPVVVLRADMAPGARLDAAAVRVEQLDLPSASLARTFASVAEVDGAVALGPLSADEILQRGAVLPPDQASGAPGAAEYSLALERDRAVGGSLVPGDVIDVLGTYGAGEAATTAVVVRRARVLAVEDGGGLASTGTTTLTLAVPSAGEVLRLAHAREAGAVSVVRATRSADAEPGPSTYRPDPARPP